MKIIGNTVGTPLPKPNLMQTDPKKGDYVKGKEEFVEQVGGGGSVAPGKDGIDCTHEWNGTVLTITSASGTSSADLKGDKGDDYTLTEADKQEIAEQAAQLVDVPTDDHINSLINTALGVIENGTY